MAGNRCAKQRQHVLHFTPVNLVCAREVVLRRLVGLCALLVSISLATAGEPALFEPDEGSRIQFIRVSGEMPTTSEVKTLAAQLTAGEAGEPAAASLKGIQPGHTTAKTLDTAWDPPREVENVDGVERRQYLCEPFQAVEVDLQGGVVRSIVVYLRDAVSAETLAKDLSLGFIPSVVITAPNGDSLGEAFPERGVMFTYAPQTAGQDLPLVKQIVLERIQPAPFVLRAETQMHVDYRLCQADLAQALKLAPNDTRAQWLRSELLLAQGDYDAALKKIDEVLAQQPSDPQFRLTRGAILDRLNRWQDGLNETKRALQLAEQQPRLKAKVLMQYGDLLANGPERDFRQAMELHQEALKVIQPFSTGQPKGVRLAAQRLMVEAYLAVAIDIGWGRWKSKSSVVPKWLARAEALIATAPINEDPKGTWQFRVARQSLLAYVGMQEPPADTRWSDLAQETGESLLEGTNDPLRLAHVQWDLGASLQDSMQIYLIAGQFDLAQKYGNDAIKHLEQALPDQKHRPGAQFLLGRAYFRLGSIYALQHKDHLQAVQWYDRAMPLLDQPLPPNVQADVGRLGETFISMGVAYWQTGSHDEAVRITTLGLERMKLALDQKLIEPGDMRVAYRNLSKMHRFLGHIDEADLLERASEALQTAAVPTSTMAQ